MSSINNLRKSLAYMLICSLLVTGLITLTTHQSEASNNSLTRSLTPSVNEPSEETVPRDETVDEVTRSRVSEAYGKLPLNFEENRGQLDNEVKYLSRGSGYTLFLTPTEAVLALRRSDVKKASTPTPADPRHRTVTAEPRPVRTSVLRMKLKGANPSPAVTGESEMGVKINYFIGNDPEQWHTGVARFERVRYTQVYPGIDMIYYGEQQQLEYDFEVASGADARQIALEFTGVKRVKVERKTGDLVLQTAGGEVRQHKPVTYQVVGGERREIESRYVMQGKGKVGIEVGEYDRTQRLVIDPALIYSTYLGGGGGGDIGYDIAVDSSGYAYVTGLTDSSDFPTENQYQTYQGTNNAFVTKLDTNASGAASLLYSTYLGGSIGDRGTGIAVDSSGHAYVTGITGSSDFPTKNQYQTDQGSADAFVTKLDTNAVGAASLLYSTYLGGNSYDSGSGIAVDSSGHAYVTGRSDSSDFPTKNQYQTYQGHIDAFVTKLDTNATGAASLSYSTYLGGQSDEQGSGIAVDASGNAYVTGYTSSINFPLLHQYQANHSSYFDKDAFVTKINTNASGAASLRYSTFLGGRNSDSGTGIAVDASGNAYVTGYTSSTDFPLLRQYQTYQGDYADAFVTKINTNASGAASLRYSTYLGGRNSDSGSDIAVDASGNAYVTGSTNSSDFPTLNQYQNPAPNYYTDAFVTKINTNSLGAASLRYSTYLGGNKYDFSNGIAIDASGNAYVTGYTSSTDFPTKNQFQTHQGNNGIYDYDAFVTKLMNTTLISGRVTSDGTTGINDVTMTLSGSESRTVVTDATGNYSFLNIQLGGNYTVTPSKSNLNFIPSAKSFTNLQVNQPNVNFTTLHATIGGRATCDGTTALSGVTMTISGSMDLSAVTNSEGNYSFELARGGNYTVTPSRNGFTFIPSAQSFTNFQANQTTVDFTTNCANISGQITRDTAGGAGLAGQTLVLTSGADFTPRAATTASDGTYSFIDMPVPRSYQITPSRSNYSFLPTQIILDNVATDQAGQNFIATLRTYTIGGVIKLGTAALAGVTVELTSPTPDGFPPRTTTTNRSGEYSFTNVPAIRDYTLTPKKTGYQFTPSSRSFTNLSANRPGISFKVTLYQVSGRITRASTTTGISGVAVTITSTTLAGFPALTVQTSSTGLYISGASLPAGHDYKIEPTKSGYTFTPATRSITNLSRTIPAGASTNFSGTGP